MKDDKDTFNYNYSAINREEIEKIRNKYISTQETNFEKLKRIDMKVINISTISSIFFGLIGAFIFSIGLILSLNFAKYSPGLIFSLTGFILMALTPLVYNVILSKMKKKYAPEILELSEKLLNN